MYLVIQIEFKDSGKNELTNSVSLKRQLNHGRSVINKLEDKAET